ncbi:protein rep [Clostridium perfringens]|uniref:protein rep n=1 Tax=Clostridium perfringens TaxID=1502 RepID=UPI001ABACA0A|nr:protein rep [Clostridium perfringens]MBO3314523.1 protein rep [Clostridium perfringens]
MNFESDLFQYYIQNDEALKEHYELIEILTQEQKHLILKRMSMDIATVFRQLGKDNKADLIKGCNSLRYIKQCLAHPEHKEFKVNYCKDRFCPICSHLKAHKQTEMLHTILSSMQKDNNYKNSYLIFVTLTQRNVLPGELSEEVDKTTKALTKLMKTDPLFKDYKTKKNGKVVVNKAPCQGVIIKKECTSSYKEQLKSIDFNPHIHLLLLVRKDYWNQKSKQWTHKKLGQKWKKALGIDYTPVVWVSLVRNGELISDKNQEVHDIDPKEAKNQKNNLSHLEPSGALKEIGKYEAKESDMLPIKKDKEGNININWSDARIVIGEIYKAYNRKRTLTYTGEFKRQKERLFGKKEADDLVDDIHGNELIDLFKRKTCKKCGAPVEEKLQKYGGKTKSYYDLSKDSLNSFKRIENEKILSAIKKKQKKTDVSSQTNISNK